MKTLLLLRQAKSSWDDAALADIDRPLAERGRKAAPRMGRELVRRGWLPDAALVSPARRTRQTWELIAAELPAPPHTHFPKRLYQATAEQLLTLVLKTPEADDTLLLLGHNPALEDFAKRLSGDNSDAEAMARIAEKFPTAALARLVFDDEWKELRFGAARLTHCLRPKDLG
jgi:phosphohistidine phosphatase